MSLQQPSEMPNDKTWPQIDFSRDPRLFAGSRKSNKRLDAKRFELDENVFRELADLCRPTMQSILSMREREYEQFAKLESNEQFFSYDISDLRRHPPVAAPEVAVPGSVEDDTADLVRIVRTVDALPVISRADIDAGGFTFYGICWPFESSLIGFVSRTNPMTTLRPGLRFFRYGDRLRKAEHPDLELRQGSDLVVGIDRLAILRTSAFDALLGDIGVVFQAVPRDIARLRSTLTATIPMSDRASDAVRQECSRLLSYARRLRALPDRLASIPTLDVAMVRRSMKRHGINDKLLVKDGAFEFDLERVELFLDVMEGRYFEDDLTSEPRRADRFSRRRQGG